MKKVSKFSITLGLCCIALIWGSTWLGIKIGLESVPPLFGVAIRFTVALAILLIVLLIRKEKIPFSRDAIFVYTVLGLFSFSLPYILVYVGENEISSGLAAILFAIYPLVVAVYSHFILPNEKLNIYKLGGILVSFAGVVVIFWSDIGLGPHAVWGMAAVLASTILQGIALVLIKKRGTHMDPFVMNAGGILFGLGVMYLLAFIFESVSQVTFDAKGLGSILYLGSFGTVVTFTVYYWLLKHIEAVYLSLNSLVTPVIAVVLGAVVLDEALGTRLYIGSAMILVGILIANMRDILSRRQVGRTPLPEEQEVAS